MGMEPALTVVAKIAPRAINAPARTARIKLFQKGIFAFLMPTASAFVAISTGTIAINVKFTVHFFHSPQNGLILCGYYYIKFTNTRRAYAITDVSFNFFSEILHDIPERCTSGLTQATIGYCVHTVRQMDECIEIFHRSCTGCDTVQDLDEIVGCRYGTGCIFRSFRYGRS